MQLVTPADVRLADEDLRYRGPSAAGHHFLPGTRHGLDIDLLDRDTFVLEQLSRTRAVWTPARGVHHDLRPAHPLAFEPFSSGRLSERQAARPPRRLKACRNPCCFSCRAVEPPSEPDSS